MDTSKAIEHFGSLAALAQAMGVSRMAVYKWRAAGLLPRGRAYQLQVQTGGALRVDERIYERQSGGA